MRNIFTTTKPYKAYALEALGALVLIVCLVTGLLAYFDVLTK